VRVLANLAERSEDIDVERAKADLKRAEEQVGNPALGVEPSVALDALALAQARIDAAK
jgi:F0F1-type ATP synthase epsilon subunit